MAVAFGPAAASLTCGEIVRLVVAEGRAGVGFFSAGVELDGFASVLESAILGSVVLLSVLVTGAGDRGLFATGVGGLFALPITGVGGLVARLVFLVSSARAGF